MASEFGCPLSNRFFANKLSLNLLQDRLACTSQLSLKGVIATNLVVKFRAKSGREVLCQAHDMGSHPVALAGFYLHRVRTFFSFVEMNGQFDTSHLFANCGTVRRRRVGLPI
jgi:hypothetical protein